MSVTTTDDKTLVCGGFTASCLQLNFQSKTWEHHSSLRSEHRWMSSMIELRRGVYVVGGEYDDVRRSSEFLATGSSVWTQGPHIPGKGVYGSCAAKLSDTEFVILGGSHDSSQALVYNEETGKWREWPRLTVSVIRQSCLGLGDTVLMAGGWNSNGGYTRRTVIFDTKTGSAREVASLKYPRALAAMVLYGGKPVILGGEDERGSKRSDGEMWNMDTETWEEADIHLNISKMLFSLVTMAEDVDCS